MGCRTFWVCTVAVWCLAGCARSTPPGEQGFVDAQVLAIASSVAGKVQQVHVREGAVVRAGELLAELDARDRAAAVKQGQANLERARQGLAQAEENLRAAVPSVKGASADIEGAQAELRDAERNFERVRGLVRGEALAKSELDAARARRDQARARVESLQASRSTQQGRAGAAEAAVALAQAEVDSAEAALEAAQVQLDQTRIFSPVDGTVTTLVLHEGEWAAPGSPVVMVEDRSRLWIRLDVGERRLEGVRLGQRAEVSVLAVPGRTFPGRVSEIGAEGTFALNRDVKRGVPDLRTFLVRVEVEPDAAAVLRPGMSAQVRWLPSPPQQVSKQERRP